MTDTPSALFTEISDPRQRKQMLIKNALRLCSTLREQLSPSMLESNQPEIIGVFNGIGYLGAVFRTIGEIDGLD